MSATDSLSVLLCTSAVGSRYRARVSSVLKIFPGQRACKNAGPKAGAIHFKLENLTSGNHLLRSSTIHVSLIKHNIRSHVRRTGSQHLLLAVNQIAGVKRGQLKSVPVRNRIRRASLHAIPAKNTTVVIDVVDSGVAFCAAYAVFSCVVGGFDVDAIRGTVGGAEETG